MAKILTPEEVAEKKARKAEYDREYRKKNAEKIKAAKKLWGQSDVKKAYDRRWAEENRERSNEIKRAWKERNPHHQAEYYEKNAEKIRERERLRTAKNPEKNRTRVAEWVMSDPERAKALYRRMYVENRARYIINARQRRQHVSANATPKWANTNAIREIYRKAAELGMHVDHIIPLRGKFVSGLHVENNLQLLTPDENRRKGNNYAA